MPRKVSPRRSSKSTGNSSLRERAEKLLRTTRTELADIPFEDIQALVHELQVHQMELEIQNEELRNAQVDLAESRDSYADLYEFAPVGYLTMDRDGLITAANLAASTLLGVNRKNLVGSKITKFIDSESQDAFYMHRQSVFMEDGKNTCELVMRRSDGAALDVQMESDCSGAGSNRQCRTAVIDITRRKLAEAALRELNGSLEQRIIERTASLHASSEFNKAILNAAVDAMITIDGDGTIIGANFATEVVFGYSHEALIGRNVKILMPEPFHGEHDGYLARYRETGEERIIGKPREVLGRRLDGSVFPVEISVNKVDHLGIFVGIVRDISKRKRAEEAFRIAHEFSERLIETAQCIVLVLDRDGRVIRFNPILEQLTRWTLQEAEGCDWFDRFEPEVSRKMSRDRFVRSLRGESLPEMIRPIVTKGGDELQVEWRDMLLGDVEGNRIGLLCTGIDVTHRLYLEREVYKSAEEEKRRIARDLHDSLGGLLSGIGMLAGRLSQKLHAGKPVVIAEVDLIAEHVREGIRQVRSLAQGLLPVGGEPGALECALERLAGWVETTSAMTCRFSAPGEPVEITDPDKANHLFRIAQEAVHNAVRHSGGTSLEIQFRKSKGTNFSLSIKDNGCGFDPIGATRENGLGLHTMEYRARAIGAHLTIQQRKTGGTEVLCVKPLR